MLQNLYTSYDAVSREVYHHIDYHGSASHEPVNKGRDMKVG